MKGESCKVEAMELSVFPDADIRKAVTVGNCDKLQVLLEAVDDLGSISHVDQDGRTILHLACASGKKRIGERLVAIIINCRVIQESLASKDGKTLVETFVNAQENLEEKSALEIAISRRNRGAIMILITNLADVNLTAKGRASPLEEIFTKLPRIMLLLLDHSFEIFEDEDDDSDEHWRIHCDFTVFTGAPGYSERGREHIVTDQISHISKAFRSNKESRSEILGHPLVQLFLHFKWIKIRSLIFFSIFYHILWSFLCLFYILDAYFFYPYNSSNGTAIEEEISAPLVHASLTQTFLPTWLVLVTAALMIVKECFEIMSSPDLKIYCKQFENWGQWILAILVILPNLFTISNWVNAMGVFISCLLILGQLNKLPGLCIYMEMLGKVTKLIFKFLIAFSPLLMAFALTFHLLMPQRSEFASIWPPFNIVKMMIMLTGEINYDDVFHADDSDTSVPYPAVTKVLFFIFVTVVTIVFQNLLIGLTVADIQSLQKKAEESSLASKLEQIYLMEMFIFSEKAQAIFKITGVWRFLQHMFLLVPGDIQRILGLTNLSNRYDNVNLEADLATVFTKSEEDLEDAYGTFVFLSRIPGMAIRRKQQNPEENFTCILKMQELPTNYQRLVKNAVDNDKIVVIKKYQ